MHRESQESDQRLLGDGSAGWVEGRNCRGTQGNFRVGVRSVRPMMGTVLQGGTSVRTHRRAHTRGVSLSCAASSLSCWHKVIAHMTGTVGPNSEV